MDELSKSIKEIWESDYIIPLYQRNFAWGKEEIEQLIDDIYHNCKDNNYFIGSLVVIKRENGKYEVIDGQQRLTVLQLLCKCLGIIDKAHLYYDSRPEVEVFFDQLFSYNSCQDFLKSYNCINETSHFYEALEIIEKELSKKNFEKEHIKNQVYLVQIPLPNDTDVASYFEIMNNRGEQLQEHEIVKSLLLEKIKPICKHKIYANIWDTCSQMNIQIQKSFDSDMRKKIFGESYNTLNTNIYSICNRSVSNKSVVSKTIDEILQENTDSKDDNRETKDKETKEQYESIIDFPNFLMYVLKLKDNDISLNSNDLLRSFRERGIKNSEEAEQFIRDLFKLRVLFDRYVIKSKNNNDDDLKWTLLKPYSLKEELHFRNTFSKDNDEFEDNDQKHIIMQESMLQVSFSNRKYKNWLYELLLYLYDKETIDIPSSDIISFLDNYILNQFETIKGEDDEALYNKGTETPHFLFNFIDYLYWVAKNNNIVIPNIDNVKDFIYKYNNSVEHHLPQSYNEDEMIKDSIGNLCLVSRSQNSSLSNKSAEDKAKDAVKVNLSNLPPKRSIMYAITTENNKWGKAEIGEHQENIKNLIEKREELLK